MNSPLVSVIVPVYNVERFVATCIESIINQEYKNLEIIIVNDGSTDSSTEICLDYSHKDKRIKYIEKENGGLSSARNKGLEYAEGKYVLYVDSDDYILPNMISECVALAEENDLDLVKSNFCRCNASGELLPLDAQTGEISFLTAEQAMDSFLNEPYSPCKKIKVSVWDALYLRERFNGITFPEGKIYEDGYYTPLIIINSLKIAHIDKSFYVYRMNDNSITGKGFNKKSLKSLDDWEFIYNNVTPVMPQYKIRIAQIWADRLTRCLEDIISDESLDPEGEYIAQINDIIKENYGLFKQACGRKQTIKKIEQAQKDLDAYYKKFVLNQKSNEPKIIRIKVFLRFLFDRRKELSKCIPLFLKRLFRKKKKVFLLGVPSYNNIGDHAISLGSRYFAKKYFPEFEYEEWVRYTDPSRERANQWQLRASIKRNDLIFLLGGGNFGTLYPQEEEYRQVILKRYKKNQVVFLSSTMFFEDSFYGRCQLKKCKTIYNEHPNLTIFLRDESSYEQTKREFCNAKCFLMPDLANTLFDVVDFSEKRDGIYICFRQDKERNYTDEERNNFIFYCKEKYKTDVGDNAFDSQVFSQQRESKIMDYLRYCASHELIVTDRFHGVIFSALTRTPCIAINDCNGKVINGLYWFKECKGIKFARNIDEAKLHIEALYGSDFGQVPDFKPYFKKAADIIKNGNKSV